MLLFFQVVYAYTYVFKYVQPASKLRYMRLVSKNCIYVCILVYTNILSSTA